jgi:hypothetical protein
MVGVINSVLESIPVTSNPSIAVTPGILERLTTPQKALQGLYVPITDIYQRFRVTGLLSICFQGKGLQATRVS